MGLFNKRLNFEPNFTVEQTLSGRLSDQIAGHKPLPQHTAIKFDFGRRIHREYGLGGYTDTHQGVAIYQDDHWKVTYTRDFKEAQYRYTHAEFMTFLARPSVTNVKVATTWADVKS